MELEELIQQKKLRLQSLKEKGVPVFDAPPAGCLAIGEIVRDFQEGRKVLLCGRIMAKRSHGKATFLDVQDSTGKIQIYAKQSSLDKEAFSVFEELEVADFIAVNGGLFKTRTGEVTAAVEEFRILSKALRPLPEKWHGLKDIELRYRQRYLDLICNEQVRKVFLLRSRIIKEIRKFLDDSGFVEVETPMMHEIAGGAAGRPFKTRHNEYGMDLYLRIAPELYLKRLLVAGLDKVYEINRSFRNEGVSTKHNPEFTMLEVYRAYANYEDMMKLTEDMIVSIVRQIFGQASFEYANTQIDVNPPWQRVSFAQLVKERFDIGPEDEPERMLAKLKAKGFAKDAERLSRSQVAKLIEDILGKDMSMRPTFVTDYFTSLCPLAKTKKENPLLSERFELYIAGLEIGNAYSELNDPVEQRMRFQEEIKELGRQEAKALDEDYVVALEHGMPAAGGLGIGIDRLVMLLTNQPSIRDVILFPLLRSQSIT